MKRWLRGSLAALGCGLLAASSATAQVGLVQPPGSLQPYQQPQPSRPTLSPYLNMMRPGVNPALNYFGLVQPQLQQIQQGRNLQQLQQQLTQLDSNVLNQGMTTGMPTAGALLTTGHPVAFMNYGTYFPLYSRGGGGLGGGLGGRTGGFGNPATLGGGVLGTGLGNFGIGFFGTTGR